MPLFTESPGGYFVAHNATIVGDVTIGRLSSFWFNAVVRGDVAPVTIGRRVNVQDGVVMLTGTVETHDERLIAERAAARIAGVKAVVNELEVRSEKSGKHTDEEIARAARKRSSGSRVLVDACAGKSAVGLFALAFALPETWTLVVIERDGRYAALHRAWVDSLA